MTTDTATPLHDALVGFLQADGWPITKPSAPVPTVETRFAGTMAEWTCTGRTFEPQGQVVFDSTLPFVVPEPVQAAMAALLVYANWELLTGAFALSPETGEVRFRTSLLLPDGAALSPPAVKGMVYANVLTVDRCLGPLAAAAVGDLTVADALDRLAL
jgi:hypothetical protein